MEIILAIVILGAGAFLFLRSRRGKGRSGGGSRFRCADCRHRGRLLDDGVICDYNGANLYKNPVQIRTCMNYEKEA